MSYKTFVTCPDGDEFMVEFDTYKEQMTFEIILDILRAEVKGLDLMEPDKDGLLSKIMPLEKTLYRQICENYKRQLEIGAGLHLFNVWEKAATIGKYKEEEEGETL